MRAAEHTEWMLGWWRLVGVERVDLAVRRQGGTVIWHRDCGLSELALAWARAENVRQGEVYARPARGYRWPVVFLDDVAVAAARRVAAKYDALVVETSPIGGCHVWLSCRRSLAEEGRKQAQSWLAAQIGADPGSISGEHLGRLAGFRNWKRGGTWVNVLAASRHGRRWAPCWSGPDRRRPSVTHSRPTGAHTAADTSESGREWGWVCGLLEAGHAPSEAYKSLVDRARLRRGKDAERYARRTVQRVLERVGRGGPAEEEVPLRF